MFIKEIIKEDATAELAASLKKTKATSYDDIDALMKKIAKKHDITAKELHDLWVDKYEVIPDKWIKDQLDEGLSAKDSVERWITVFKSSKHPKFAGKTPEQREKMARAAYYRTVQNQKFSR